MPDTAHNHYNGCGSIIMLKTKIRQFISWQRVLAFTGLCLLIVISFQSPLSAQSVSEGYSSEHVLQRGMIVRLKENDATKVEPVGMDGSEHVHGVVVAANDAPVTLAKDGQKVFVSNVGQYEVLVSDQNGSINSGDYVSVSSLAGIGMKTSDKEPFIIGRALTVFDGKQNIISSVEIKDTSGKTRSVNIGRIKVDIVVTAKNPLLKETEPNVPELLRKASETIAGKPVNAVRAYLGLIVFIITTIVATSLLYGGVRSAITSIGRNPLSRKSILRGMVQVVLTGLIVFITGVFGVYLILRI